MFKKVTGTHESKDEARDDMVDSRQRFKLYFDHLRGKKDEYKDIKESNNQEREEIKKQQKLAEQFKFTKMTKKTSFLPALKSKGFFKDTNSVHAVGAQYVDDRDKYRMHAPERAFL